jgi:hypothetical protein
MLCTIALRRTRSNDDDRYDLRITGKTALGPSGTGGQETRTSQTADEVRSTLQQLGLGAEALAAAEDILNDPRSTGHFTPIAEDVQIPFETLDRADIALFD